MGSFAELHFTEHDVQDGGSLALFVEDRSRCGIYWLDFEDGASYVGQSVDARTRLATHRRRWSDVTTARFAECLPERLDELEVAAIQHVQKTRPLRNVLLTSRPGGDDDLVVTVRQGQSLALPWDRGRRGRLNDTPPYLPDDVPAKANWERLSRHEQYPHLVASLRALLLETFPSPAHTAEVLWTLTALPSTNKSAGWRRLCTLSAGRVEILRVFERTTTRKTIEWYLNLHPDASARKVRPLLEQTGARNAALKHHTYKAITKPVLTLNATGLHSLDALLQNEYVLDQVYGLVVTLMRQGINPLRHHHSHALARDVLYPHGSILALDTVVLSDDHEDAGRNDQVH
jgi:hypothetical protein